MRCLAAVAAPAQGNADLFRCQAARALVLHANLSPLVVKFRTPFCLVELWGLEPLAPCLQSTPGLSETVAHLALRHQFIRWIGPCRDALWSALVVSRRHMSARRPSDP